MKTLYTILFFADTLVLVCLSYLLLHKFDNGSSIGTMISIFSGIAASIFLLIFLLKKYIGR